MAIKGLKELLEKHAKSTLTPEQFEEELNKLLPETHIPKSVYNELNEKYKLIEKQKTDTDKLLADANKSLKDSEEFKGKYESLLAQQKTESENFKKELAEVKRGFAIESALEKAGSRNTKSVRALLDDSKIILGEDGKLVGLTEQLTQIKKDNSFLFAEDDPNGGFKPNFGGGGGPQNPPGETLAARINSAMGV